MGNVEVGRDISLGELAQNYDGVLFAYGASQDRELRIPGEDLAGVFSARAFVGWYNGLPEYADLSPQLDASDTAIIIGNGNVALDVARVLLTSVDSLRSTDIAERALQHLLKSKIQRVHVVGRRGPLQTSFTVKEVRELLELPNVGFWPLPSTLLPGLDVKLPRVPKRMSQLLSKWSNRPREDSCRTWSLDFLRSPVRFHATDSAPSRLNSVGLAHNAFVGDPFDRSTKVEPTGETSTLETSIAFRSVGYKAEPMPGMTDLDIHFDKTLGIIPNVGGRVINGSQTLKDLYCTGWVKLGPTGVIASTMEDAFATAELIAQDWGSKGSTKMGWDAIKHLVPQRVDWRGWLNIDAAEKAKGVQRKKSREKFVTVKEMLQAST